MVAVLLVVHVRLYREGISAIVTKDDRLQIVGIPDEPSGAVAQAVAHRPDVALVDMSMPGALDLIASIVLASPATKVIALGVDDDTEVVSCVEAGASGYITRDSSVEMLVTTIESVGREEMICSPRMAATLARQLALRSRTQKPPASAEPLTARQQQVLQLLRAGLTNKEIAHKLFIAEATVKNHVHHLLERLKVPSRMHAAQRATGVASRPIEASRRAGDR
jgi:DNA-binding NarL/FixJ family response regulator